MLQASDKRTKNRGRFNIVIMHLSQEKAQLYYMESYKSFSVVWIEKRNRRAKKSLTMLYFTHGATQRNHIIAIRTILH